LLAMHRRRQGNHQNDGVVILARTVMSLLKDLAPGSRVPETWRSTACLPVPKANLPRTAAAFS
jgi:hypothetical protein